MSETLLSILKFLYNQQSKQFTRAEIEEQIPRVKKRAILNALSQLIKDKRVERKGQGALTVYIFSQSYHQELEESLYIYQNLKSV
jgi:predicted transcriptional regulator of viral defense system